MIIDLIILFVLILLSAFFSASETAFISLSRHRVLNMVNRKAPGAKIIQKLKQKPANLLSTILIGNNLVNIAASVLATYLVMSVLEARGSGGTGVVFGLATGVMTFFILVFGEITPKTVAIRNAERLSLVFAWPIYILSFVFAPLGWFLTLFARPFIFIFGGKLPSQGPFLTQEELKVLITEGAREGVLEREEKEMISSIFEFGETKVHEVMTPRPDIKALDVKLPVEDAVKMVKESGHSRLPLFEGNIDNIVGVVYSKDLLSCKPGQILKEYSRTALFIPEGKMVDELLHQMQSARTHIAIVVDEYGVTSGIVTLEDLIEEIVGEIYDEFERGEKSWDKIDQNTYIVDGRLSISDLKKNLDIGLPESEEYDTVGGYVFTNLGKVPAVGDSMGAEGLKISVEKVHKRRITRIKIMRSKIEDRFVGG